MLTIMTENMGIVSACAYGVRSNRSKMRAGTQFLCFGEFVLSKKGGEVYRVDSVEIEDAFFPVCEDIVKLALANYICTLAVEMYGGGDRNILRLLLNTLYALAYRDTKTELAKAVFEIKLAQYAGYEPCMDSCIVCGKSEKLCAFDTSGGMKCASCRTPSDVTISGGVYNTICYILAAEEKKIFSFAVTDEICAEVADIAEKYIIEKSERTYKALDYLKRIT